MAAAGSHVDATSGEAARHPGEPPLPQPQARITILSAQAEAVRRGRARLVTIGAVFSLAFALVGVRLVDLMVLDRDRGGAGRQAAAIVAPRGDIVDRGGRVLANDIATSALIIRRDRVLDRALTVERLTGLFPDIDAAGLAKRLEVSRGQITAKWDLSDAQRAEVLGLGLPGVGFEPDVKRVYPQGSLASHAIGVVDHDHNGILGAERAFDAEIRAAAVDGTRVPLSIDVSVQYFLEQELERGMATYGAKGAYGLVLDVHTGELLGLASLPSFDANGGLPADPARQFNNVTNAVFELGSVLKILTVAMALDAGVATPETKFDATKPFRVGGHVIRDYYGKRRALSVREILQYSSNIGAAKMAYALGTDAQKAFLARFGFMDAVPVDLAERGAPMLPARWGQTETATIAFGHGLSATPLHLAAAVGAIANGGVYVDPTIRARPPGSRFASRRVISPAAAKATLDIMRTVVAEGTGRKADAAGYPVAGKTGTAEKSVGGRYDRSKLLSSFIGVFPAGKPDYLVLVLYDEPVPSAATNGRATGGATAAPTVGAIVARIAPILKVAPVRERDPIEFLVPASVQ